MLTTLAVGKSARESALIEGYALNCVIAADGMPKHVNKAKIAFLDFSLEKPTLPHGMSWRITDPNQTHMITKRFVFLDSKILSFIIEYLIFLEKRISSLKEFKLFLNLAQMLF